jgi:hypothetical protein
VGNKPKDWHSFGLPGWYLKLLLRSDLNHCVTRIFVLL